MKSKTSKSMYIHTMWTQTSKQDTLLDSQENIESPEDTLLTETSNK